jgi:hypothetical protein
MKIISIILILLFSTASYSWEIVKEDGMLYLKDEKLHAKVKVFTLSEHSPVETVTLSDNLIILRYLESRAGTKYLAQTFNCSIYDQKAKIFISTDVLCKSTTALTNGKTTENAAIFKLEKDQLNYSFEELNEKFPLKH